MFLLQITKLSGSNATSSIVGNQVVREKGIEVSYRPGNYNSFSFRIGDKLALGEANIAVTFNEIETVLQQIDKNTGQPEKALGNDILNLAIVNFKQRSLTIANSITNSRPLLYWKNSGKIVCTTCFKPMESCGVRLELNEQVMPEFMAYRQLLPPRTMYQGINRLIAGQFLTIGLDEFKITNDCRWKVEPPWENNGKVSIEDRLDRIQSILKTGLEAQLKQSSASRVLLSGGNDSSLLASMCKAIDSEVTSTSTSFSFLNRQDHEVEYANSAARHIGIEHEICSFTSEDYLRGLVESIHINEEPVDHLQSVLLYLIHRRQQGIGKVLYINGLEADSIFGDQLHKRVYSQSGLLNFIRYSGMRPAINLACSLFSIKHPRLLLLAQDFAPRSRSENHILWSVLRYVDPKIIREHFGFDHRSTLGARFEVLSDYRNLPILDQIMIAGILYATSIQYWQKLAVRCGHSYFFPFIIPELMRYLFSVSWPEKLVEGKYLVRQLLNRNGFSNDFINRPKQSFGFPLKYWAVKGSLFQPLVDMVAPEFPSGIVASLQREDYSRAMLLWNIINLHLFKKLMIENVEPDDLTGEILDRYRILNR